MLYRSLMPANPIQAYPSRPALREVLLYANDLGTMVFLLCFVKQS